MQPFCHALIYRLPEMEKPPYLEEVFWAMPPHGPLPPSTPPDVAKWILGRPQRIKRWLASAKWRGEATVRLMQCKRQSEAVTITAL